MKYKIFVLSLLFALTSCNTQADVPTPTSTLIPTETPAPPTQTSTPTESPTPTLSPEPEVVEYEIAKEPYKFRECTIEVDETTIAGKIAEVVRSLKKYHATDRIYDPSKLMLNKLLNLGSMIVYDPNAPDYTDPATRPYHRGAFCLTKFTTPDGKTNEYFTSFVQYYVAGLSPEQYPWVVAVAAIKPMYDKSTVDIYMNDMNFPVLMTSSNSLAPFIEGSDPLVNTTFEKFGQEEMQKRYARFIAGDYTALDAEDGIVLITKIARTADDIYR